MSGARRLRWVALAIAGERGLVADERELVRRGPSYTFETLASLRMEFPRASLCLLLGQDAARQLPRWHRWRELPDLANLVFFARPRSRFASGAGKVAGWCICDPPSRYNVGKPAGYADYLRVMAAGQLYHARTGRRVAPGAVCPAWPVPAQRLPLRRRSGLWR